MLFDDTCEKFIGGQYTELHKTGELYEFQTQADGYFENKMLNNIN